MNFTRRRLIPNVKTWLSECGQYRIVWRDEVAGVAMPDRYYATVRARRFDGEEWWAFVDRRGPYKTFAKAESDCDRHRKLWAKFIELSHADGRKNQPLADLIARRARAFDALPVWVECEANPDLVRRLPCRRSVSNPSDVSETSNISDSNTDGSDSPSDPIQPSGPASPVEAEADTTTPKTTARSKATKTPRSTHAMPATAPEEEPEKPAKKRTAKRSKSGKKKAKPTKKTNHSAKAA